MLKTFAPPVGAVENRTESAQLETLLVPTGSDSSECSFLNPDLSGERHRDSALRNPIHRGVPTKSRFIGIP